MSDYPMLISNKLHSFRNFAPQKYVNARNIGILNGTNLYLRHFC